MGSFIQTGGGLAMDTRGFIYVLENESMPGIVKVGMTARLPESRAAELYTTGVPTPFVLRFAMFVEAVEQTEKMIHNTLRSYRICRNREFFKIDASEAIYWIIKEISYRWDIAVLPGKYGVSSYHFKTIADICGVDDSEVGRVLPYVAQSSWKAASAAYSRDCELLKSQLQLDNQEMCDGA
jgi:hypothetical protein